jgi:hypothetical protein
MAIAFTAVPTQLVSHVPLSEDILLWWNGEIDGEVSSIAGQFLRRKLCTISIVYHCLAHVLNFRRSLLHVLTLTMAHEIYSLHSKVWHSMYRTQLPAAT